MKVVILLLLFGLVSGIRVPNSWPEKDYKLKKYVRPYHKIPYTAKNPSKRLPYASIYIPKSAPYFKNFPKPAKHNVFEHPFHFDTFSNFNADPGWTPIFPNQNFNSPNSQQNNLKLNLKQLPKEELFVNEYKDPNNSKSPLTKNYRDDKTHEPNYEDNNDDGEINESINEEVETEVPTKPIYPGEGEWAKPGKIHRPHFTDHTFEEQQNESEETEDPDGVEIFKAGQELFKSKFAKFENDPNKISHSKPTEDHESLEENNEEESEEEEFVPMMMYAQVRRTEHEKHLPSNDDSAENGRLKEVVRDSKIHTVYTEEGYEDTAYDHEGHEKEAADSEGYSEHLKDSEEDKANQPLKEQVKTENFSYGDQNPNGSNQKETKVIPKKKIKMKGFIKDEQTKIMSLKEMDNGNMMMVVSKQKKVMLKPMNDSKTQKYVQVSPIVVQDMQINKGNDALNNIRDIIQMEQTLKSSENPENKRKKRFTNDFPNLEVDTHFIHNINHNIPPTPPSYIEQKYPYYNMDSKNLHHNSPLRYSESLNNIPWKTENEMSFYEEANKIHCPEVDDDVEAVRDEIGEIEKNVDDGEGTGKKEGETKSPRLGKLGTRIDCFKRKYFGDNPLDSPIFTEKEVEAVQPWFKKSSINVSGFQSSDKKSPKKSKKYHSKFSLKNIQNNLKQDPDIATDEKIRHLLSNVVQEELQSISVNPTASSSNEVGSNILDDIMNTVKQTRKTTTEVTTTTDDDIPQISLITTPDYTVDITPRHIYDQIKLLNYLPVENMPLLTTEQTLIRVGKSVPNNNIDLTKTISLTNDSTPPAQQALKRRRRLRYKTKPPKIYNNNKYRTNNNKPNQQQNLSRNFPRYSKPDGFQVGIAPFDQLNVFADVINNIKNGTNDPEKASSSSVYRYMKNSNDLNLHLAPPKQVTVKPISFNGYLNNIEENFYRTSTFIPTIITSTTPTTTTQGTTKANRGTTKFNPKNEDEFYDEYLTNYGEYGRKKYPKTSRTTTSTTTISIKDLPALNTDVKEFITVKPTTQKTTTPIIPLIIKSEVLGLVPPSDYNYKTIFEPHEDEISLYQQLDKPAYQTNEEDEDQTDSETSGSDSMNNYYVVGMTPPPMHHNIYSQNSFNHKKHYHNNRTQNRFLRRGKRSPQRKSYFEVVRGSQKENVDTSDDDDYVPHRPKNWHYDEKTKRIVYDTPAKKEEVEDEDVEVVEYEVTDAPASYEPKSTRRAITSTTPLNGPSLLDYVNKLKSSKEYVEIPDPTTRDPKLPTETTPIPSTTSSKPTNPPEFLNILSKVRNTDGYKKIEDKNKTTTRKPPTTQPPIDDDDDSYTSETLGNFQNSRQPPLGMDFKIFDVTDFIPKIKNYVPKTSIDYSKYKTIQRAPVRPNTEASKTESQETTVKTSEPSNHRMDENIELENPSQFSNTKNIRGDLPASTVFPVFTADSTTKADSTVTKSTFLRTRGRKRPTTLKPSTTKATSSRPTRSTTLRIPDDMVRITAEKPKRVFPRRRPTRIKRPQTDNAEDSANAGSEKLFFKRHNDVSRKAKIVILDPIVLANSDNKNESNRDEISFLENINRLKEVNVDESLADYSDTLNNTDEFSEEK